MSFRPALGQDPREGNASMSERILAMSPQPLREGGWAYRVLEVPGRISGITQRVPLAAFQWGGRPYLISPNHGRVWAKNLRAAKEAILLTSDGPTRYHTVTVEGTDEAVAPLRAYVAQLTFAAPQFPFQSGDPDEAIKTASSQTAVFRLEAAN